MKKVFKVALEILVVLSLIAIFTHISAFASSLPMPDEASNVYQGEGQLPSPGITETGEALDGVAMVKILVLNALKYFKVIFGILAILMITIMGFRMAMFGEEEETITKMKKGLIYAVIALILVSMSEEIAKIFNMEESTILAGPQEILNRIQVFDRQVEIVITFAKYVIGTYAIIMVIRSAAALITGGGKDEQTSKHKKALFYSLGGLILVYIGDVFINKVFYKIDKTSYDRLTGVHPTVDPQEGVRQLVGITNFIVTFVGPLAILMLIVGAILYATSGGEEEGMERAKRVLISTVVAIIIIYGAFAIVSTVISGQLSTTS